MLSIELPAVIESLRVFQEAASREAEAAGFSPKGILNLQLVLEEILTNIFHHAYGENGGPVFVELEAASGEVRIRIEDRGKPFNLLEAEEPDTTSPMEDRMVGGLGIMLIRRLAKHLSYKREAGRNIVEILMEEHA